MRISKTLTLLMLVAAVAFGVRFSDFIKDTSRMDAQAAAPSQDELANMSPAAGTAPPSEDKLEKETKPAEVKKEDAKPAPDKEAKPAEGGKPEIEAPSLTPDKKTDETAKAEEKKEDWKGADDLDDEYSDVKMELFSDLSKRRKDLDAKEKELALREALLKAAQAELEQKTKELTTIKGDIETLLKKQTEQEDARIKSLVKIYEGMKAKDAAKIFDNLEMDVLLQLLGKMSERKSAPIIAAMDAEKARTLTIMLAEQNKLPTVPQIAAP